MNFLRQIARLFAGGRPASDSRFLTLYVLNQRCREPLSGEIDLMNELSRIEEGEHAFFTRKVLHTSGRNHCFSEVEVQVWFDAKKNVAEHTVTGGRWLTQSEYETELARFNAPPVETPADDAPGSQPGGDEPGAA